MWNLIKLAVLVVVGLLAYNFFFGNEEEKADAKDKFEKIGQGLKNVWNEGVDIIKDERQKFKEGKYDNAIENVGGVLTKLKEGGGKLLDRIGELEIRKDGIQKKIEEAESKEGGMTAEEKAALEKEIEELTADTEELIKKSKEEKE